jgi:hypothetical protein
VQIDAERVLFSAVKSASVVGKTFRSSVADSLLFHAVAKAAAALPERAGIACASRHS